MDWEDFEREYFTPEEIAEMDRVVSLQASVIKQPKGRRRTIAREIDRMIVLRAEKEFGGK